MLIPPIRKTWAPQGFTPILHHSYRRDKLSAIGGLSVSPRLRRLGLYVRLHAGNITGTEVIDFFRLLLRHLRGNVVVLWDGGKPHHRADVTAFISNHPRLQVERFPSYAPELNPIEFVWGKTKHALGNSNCQDLCQLRGRLHNSFHRTRQSQQLLRSCVYASRLPLWV